MAALGAALAALYVWTRFPLPAVAPPAASRVAAPLSAPQNVVRFETGSALTVVGLPAPRSAGAATEAAPAAPFGGVWPGPRGAARDGDPLLNGGDGPTLVTFH